MLVAAEAAFPGLTPAEKKLLRCFATGKRARFELDGEKQPAERARAEVVRWLLANGTMADGSRTQGLYAMHLLLDDEDLNLDGVAADFPVVLTGCHLRNVLLRDARLVTLRLSGSHCEGIAGDRLRIDHGLLLNEGFRAYGTVWLPSIVVGGDLNCDEGRFAGGAANSYALLLDGARVEGRIFLRRALAAHAFEAGTQQPRDRAAAPANAGWVSAQGARVGGNLVCIGTRFCASSDLALDLSSSVVSGDAAFEHVKANGRLTLRQTKIDGTVTFRGADLESELDLTRSSVGGDLAFGRPTAAEKAAGAPDGSATLGSELLLNGATIGGQLDMGTANLGRLALVDLSRSTIGYLDDSDVSWPAEMRVLLEGIRLGGLDTGKSNGERLAWLEAQGDEDWSPQPYHQVANALKLAGEEDAAREISIERERDRSKYGGLNWISLGWNALLDVTIRFGYRPYVAFFWTFIVIVLGWLVFVGFWGPVEFTHEGKPPHLYPFVYSVDAFLPIVDLGQASARSPIGLLPNVALWLEICLGWLLTTLGVVGVTGLVRKD
jgi:hypothetical protein